MENLGRKVVSTQDLFPIMKEYLVEGLKVKFTVSGDSMRPWVVHNRDQVILTSVDGKRLKRGDIILFNLKGRYILHRIYKKKTDGYLTIGDACRYEDGLILPDDIIGVVETICRKGKEINCNSAIWRFVFSVWQKLLPVRNPILTVYYFMLQMKSRFRAKTKSR